MAASIWSFSFGTVLTAVSLISLFSFCSGVQCTKIDKCSCNCDGKVFDVSKIGSSDPTKPAFSNIRDPTISGMTYDYNGCTGVTLGDPSSSTCSNSAVCGKLVYRGVTQYLGLGAMDPTYHWDVNANAPVAVYSNTASGSSAHVTIVCDESAAQTTVKNTKTNSDVYLELRSADVCPGGGGGGGGGGSSSTSLSIGSIMLIICLSLVVVYGASGVVYMTIRHKGEGRYVLKSEFWRGLPSDIKAGFVFTYSATLGRFFGKKNNYEDI